MSADIVPLVEGRWHPQSYAKYQFYTKKHRGGCTRSLLRPVPTITNRARSVRLVIVG